LMADPTKSVGSDRVAGGEHPSPPHIHACPLTLNPQPTTHTSTHPRGGGRGGGGGGGRRQRQQRRWGRREAWCLGWGMRVRWWGGGAVCVGGFSAWWWWWWRWRWLGWGMRGGWSATRRVVSNPPPTHTTPSSHPRTCTALSPQTLTPTLPTHSGAAPPPPPPPPAAAVAAPPAWVGGWEWGGGGGGGGLRG
jgi:hypothetical protein